MQLFTFDACAMWYHWVAAQFSEIWGDRVDLLRIGIR